MRRFRLRLAPRKLTASLILASTKPRTAVWANQARTGLWLWRMRMLKPSMLTSTFSSLKNDSRSSSVAFETTSVQSTPLSALGSLADPR